MESKVSTVDLNAMSYQEVVDHLNGRSGSYTRASEQSEAERQAALESQRYARQRYRDIWVPRRDGLRGIFQHRVQGMSVAFNAATSFTQLVFNARNPMTLMSNTFRFAMSISSEIMGHMRKGKYVREDAANMQNVIWDHVNNDMLPILLRRPIKNDGTVMEIPELRPHLIGIMNDEFVKKPRATPDSNNNGNTQVNWAAREKIARLLDCQIHPVTKDLIPNEKAFKKNINDHNEPDGDRYRVLPVPLPVLDRLPVQEASAPKARGPAPAPAMA
jgi:hypothetical protein